MINFIMFCFIYLLIFFDMYGMIDGVQVGNLSARCDTAIQQTNTSWSQYICNLKNDFSNAKKMIYAINVGQGNCIIVKDGSEAILIDAGWGLGFDNYYPQKKDTIKDLITAILSKTIVKGVFITHPHEDHYNMFSSDDYDANNQKIKQLAFLGKKIQFNNTASDNVVFLPKLPIFIGGNKKK